MNRPPLKWITFNQLAGPKGLFLLLNLLLASACSVQRPIQREQLGELGYFEFREPSEEMAGVIVGAPHGNTDLDAIALARQISDRTGAGLVAAYGFKSKRLSVAQPLVRAVHDPKVPDDPLKRGSVFREFKKILYRTAQGELDFYVGIHGGISRDGAAGIEVTSNGFTFEELNVLKEFYIRIRDGLVETNQIRKLSMAIDPLDQISWRIAGIRHHGVLMVAEKGLSIRILGPLMLRPEKNAYSQILSLWVNEAVKLIRQNPQKVPEIEVKLMDLGRFELSRPKTALKGVVVGSPHGSFDLNTAEMVKRLGRRTGFAAVIATGFTPTEAGGWRINVNRPTEKAYPPTDFELRSERARKVYKAYKDLVMVASNGALDLYIDIHGYSTGRKIQVATVGVSLEQARKIKSKYREIRDVALKRDSDIVAVDLVIEPLDEIEIGAWPAKAGGILGVARKSLHFELPSELVLQSRKARDVYTRVLGDLLKRAAVTLVEVR